MHWYIPPLRKGNGTIEEINRLINTSMPKTFSNLNFFFIEWNKSLKGYLKYVSKIKRFDRQFISKKKEKRKKETLANESHKQNWRKQIEIFRPARDTSHEDNNLETVVCR